MFIFLKPADTLFFRDGKPFDAGTDSFAGGIFPPYPSTLYGVLRSAIMMNAKVDFEKFIKVDNYNHNIEEVGTKDKLGTLSIAGPWLAGALKNSLYVDYFPSPLNLVLDENNRREIYFITPRENNSIPPLWDLPITFNPLLPEMNVKVKSAEAYLNIAVAKKLLKGVIPYAHEIIQPSRLFKRDIKTGIKRNISSRVAQEGMLYSEIHFQMNMDDPTLYDVGLIFEVSHDGHLPEKGYIQIGGEARGAFIQKVRDIKRFDESDEKEIAEIICKNKRFFIWLITPAIFKNNFLPDFIDKDSLEGSIECNGSSINVRLISCQTGRAIHIGGFDLAKGFPKIMRKAVPARSIYFFSLLDHNISDGVIRNFIKTYTLKPMPSHNEDIRKQGFGVILIGGV